MKILLGLVALSLSTFSGPCSKSELQTASTITSALAPIACNLTSVAVGRSSASAGAEVGQLCPTIATLVQGILDAMPPAPPGATVPVAAVVLVKNGREQGTMHGDVALRAKSQLHAAGITLVDPATGKPL